MQLSNDIAFQWAHSPIVNREAVSKDGTTVRETLAGHPGIVFVLLRIADGRFQLTGTQPAPQACPVAVRTRKPSRKAALKREYV